VKQAQTKDKKYKRGNKSQAKIYNINILCAYCMLDWYRWSNNRHNEKR